MQPSCSSSKTPSGSSLLITKASSTYSVGPLHAAYSLPVVSCVFFDGCCCFVTQTEKYFDMKKTQCKEGLDIYKKFLTRMTRISEFLKVAEVCLRWFFTAVAKALLSHRRLKRVCLSSQQQVGIDRGDIPDLSQVSSAEIKAFLHCFFLIFISNLFVSVCAAKKKNSPLNVLWNNTSCMLRMFPTTGGLLFLYLLLFPLLSSVNNGDLQETATVHIYLNINTWICHMLMLADTQNLSVKQEVHFIDMFLYLTERGESLDRLNKTKSDLLLKVVSMCCSALARATTAMAPDGILSPVKVPTSLYSCSTAQLWDKNREQLDVFRINCTWKPAAEWHSPSDCHHLYILYLPPLSFHISSQCV